MCNVPRKSQVRTTERSSLPRVTAVLVRLSLRARTASLAALLPCADVRVAVPAEPLRALTTAEASK